MNKTTILAGIATAVVWYVLGFLFYGISGVMDNYATEAGLATDRGEEMSMLWLTIGHIVMGLFFAVIYSKWARGTHNFKHGGELGIIIGLMLTGMSMIWYATTDLMTGMGHVVDSVFSIINLAIGGGVCALVFGKMDD